MHDGYVRGWHVHINVLHGAWPWPYGPGPVAWPWPIIAPARVRVVMGIPDPHPGAPKTLTLVREAPAARLGPGRGPADRHTEPGFPERATARHQVYYWPSES